MKTSCGDTLRKSSDSKLKTQFIFCHILPSVGRGANVASLTVLFLRVSTRVVAAVAAVSQLAGCPPPLPPSLLLLLLSSNSCFASFKKLSPPAVTFLFPIRTHLFPSFSNPFVAADGRRQLWDGCEMGIIFAILAEFKRGYNKLEVRCCPRTIFYPGFLFPTFLVTLFSNVFRK